MSAVETVESAYYLKYGFDANFTLSPQQLIDCDLSGQGGCDYGWTDLAFDYIKTVGLEADTAYPYTAMNGNCSYNPGAVKAKVTGWKFATAPCATNGSCPHQDEQTLLNNLAALGPISVTVDASNWGYYTGGIFPAAAYCGNGTDSQNHDVQLVGYSSDQGGYWIVRNSWSDIFGENGYIYLPYGQNACGLADHATIATIA